MSDRINFTCPGCKKTIGATVRQVGVTGPCPACGRRVKVPPFAPQEQGPVLVPYESYPESPSGVALNR
jgi:endogenous inhibitor of DNA gyrase (YacG/DUF329 family)